MSKQGTFIITFLSYALLQGSRSMWSYMQKYIVNQIYLGVINLTFLITYGICMNRITPKLCSKSLKGCLGYGVLSTGVIMLIISILDINGQVLIPFILLLMIINGFGQSLCFPSCTNILGNWFKNDKIGMIMGFWMGCSSFGSIVSLTLADVVVQRLQISPGYGFAVIGISLLICGYLIIRYLITQPKELSINIELIEINTSHTNYYQEITQSEVSLWQVPGIISYITCYSCLKGTFNGFIFWLPFYLQSKSSEFEKNASMIYSMFDLGIYSGGIIIGRLGDLYRNRVLIFVPCLAFSITAMMVTNCSDSMPIYYICIFCIGFFHGGPLNNISGAITVELADRLKGNKSAISSVSSVIESFGSLTGATFQMMISYLDINSIFFFFIGVTLIAEIECILILKLK